ncbi:MAG: hypothetical protein ACR2G7_00145, partial [Acidimicrobiales bacterium]
MCAGTTFPVWQARCIQRLLDRGDAKPCLLIVNRRSPEPKGRLAKLGRRLRRRDVVWALFTQRFVAGRAKASKPVDLAPVLSEVPVLRCQAIRRGRYSEYFADEDVAEVVGHDLDFIL